jgi:PAS domain S-box-containing protein
MRIRPKDLGIGRLFESVRDAVIVAEASTGRIILWNPAASKVFGYSSSEALGLCVEALIPERLKAQHRAGIARYHETRHGHYVDSDKLLNLPAVSKTGEELDVEMSLSPISPVHTHSDSGSFLLAIVRDVTQRKQAEDEVRRLNENLEHRIAERTKRLKAVLAQREQAEQKLRESEERFRTLVRNSTDVIATITADGTVTYESDSVERVLGYKAEEMIGTSNFDLIHPDDQARAQGMFAELLSVPGGTLLSKIRARHRDGSWRYLEITGTNLLHHPGIASIVTNYSDITEQRRVEDALREARDRFRSVFDQAPIGVAVVSIEGRYMQVNRSLCEILGRSEEDLLATTWQRITHPDDLAASFDHARRIVESVVTRYHLEKRFLHTDGHVIWASLSVSLVRSSEGRPLYFISHLQDITERKKVEEELWETNRRLRDLAVLKADFTAMVAHELDTPLAVIRGYTEMLADGKLEPAEQSRALTKIQAETDVLSSLVLDVRTASAFEREDFTVEPQRIPVRTLLDAAAGFGATLPGNHPLVTHNGADQQVWADPQRIVQVLRNLLSNAAKYSPDGAPITVRSKPGETSGRVRIEVADHGPGIHPEDASHIFEKFGRGRDHQGRKAIGVGLGLYLSRRIVRAHGSDLTLDKTHETGAVFGFDLKSVR